MKLNFFKDYQNKKDIVAENLRLMWSDILAGKKEIPNK